MNIVDLQSDDQEKIRLAANLLVEGFKVHWPNAWSDTESALEEVRESFGPDRLSRIAVEEDGTVLGWIGGIREYDGHAWELHPLIVHPDFQGSGIGRALVKDLERLVCQRGGSTIYLGTDDEDHMTTLSDKDLFPNVLEHLANIKNLRGHPYEFYQKLGFEIVGVIPDPDLYQYEIYRVDTSGGPYAKIGDVPALVTEFTDWSVSSGLTYYYALLAVDTSFNKSSYSNEVEGTAQARPVQVTFIATLPDTTPDGDDIYISGSFNGWNPAGTLMTRSDLFATVTLTFYEGDLLEYKYTRGSWDVVEKDAACVEISNRTAIVVYGLDGTMTLEDTVENWRNTGPCGD